MRVSESLYGFNAVVFGPSKAGKTWLMDTMPPPRLILDAEGKTRFLPSEKVYWDPMAATPPVADGTWETCIVPVRSYKVLDQARQWLASGNHPFRSAGLDSISEAQQRAVDDIAGTRQMQLQDWGALLRQVGALAREMRDLTTHPTNPLDAVVINAMAITSKDTGIQEPYMQGQISTWLPYFFDLCVYLHVTTGQDGLPVRRLLVAPTVGYATGEAVGGALGAFIDNPNISTMMETIRNDQAAKRAAKEAAKQAALAAQNTTA